MNAKQTRRQMRGYANKLDDCECFLCGKHCDAMKTESEYYPPYNVYTCKNKLLWEKMYYIQCCCVQHPPPCDNTNEEKCSCPRCHCSTPFDFWTTDTCEFCENKKNIYCPCLHLEGRCKFNHVNKDKTFSFCFLAMTC